MRRHPRGSLQAHQRLAVRSRWRQAGRRGSIRHTVCSHGTCHDHSGLRCVRRRRLRHGASKRDHLSIVPVVLPARRDALGRPTRSGAEELAAPASPRSGSPAYKGEAGTTLATASTTCSTSASSTRKGPPHEVRHHDQLLAAVRPSRPPAAGVRRRRLQPQGRRRPDRARPGAGRRLGRPQRRSSDWHEIGPGRTSTSPAAATYSSMQWHGTTSTPSATTPTPTDSPACTGSRTSSSRPRSATSTATTTT